MNDNAIAHPDARDLLERARSARNEVRLDEHAALVDRLESDHGDDPIVAFAVEAERLRDTAYNPHTPDEFVALRAHLDDLLDRAPADPAIVARLLVARGGCHARLLEPGWGRAATDDYLAAARSFLAAGEPDAAATTVVNVAWSVDLVLHGIPQTSLRLGEAIEMVASPGHAIRFLSQRARLNLWNGAMDPALADLARAESLAAENLVAAIDTAYLCWAVVEIHAVLGHRERVLAALTRADGLRGPWYDTITGLSFETHAVDALSHLGLVDAARTRLDAVVARRDEQPGTAAMAEICFHARVGDPTLVEPAWEVLRLDDAIEAWDLSRMGLLVAHARARAGGPVGPIAAQSLDDAERLGVLSIVSLREADILDAVLDAACDEGSGAAMRLRRSRRGHRVTLLGAPAVQTPDGRSLPLTGQLVTLLAVLAGQDQGLSPARLDEMIWDDPTEEGERNLRVRRLLHRIRAVAPIVVRTPAGRLAIDPDTTVDIVELDLAIAACRDAGDGPLLAATLAAARGLASVAAGVSIRMRPDLPDDVRTHLIRQLHWVHVRSAAFERDRGRDDLARNELRHALDHMPDDDQCAALLARLLLAEGRRVDAAEILRTTHAVLTSARVTPSSAFTDLASRLLAEDGTAPM